MQSTNKRKGAVLSFMVVVICLIGFPGFAQITEQLERKLNKAAPDCHAIAYNSQLIIPEYYEGGQLDSIAAILDYWKESCGEVPEITHANILLDIYYDEFSEAKYPNLLQLLINYDEYSNGIISYIIYGRYSQEDIKAREVYYGFLKAFAKKISSDQSPIGLEADVINFYAGNNKELTDRLKARKYEGSSIQSSYDEVINSLIYDNGLVFGIYAGSWSPTGNLSTLGTHPEIGILYGSYFGRYGFDLIGGFRFIDSPNEYRIRQDDSIYVSNNYTGVSIALQGYYSLFKNLRNDVLLTTAFGYDGITLQSEDEDEGKEAVTTGTLNINVGLQYRYYYNYKSYVAFDVRYNYLNFSNNINDELAGHGITARLIFGFTDGNSKQRQLKALGY